MAKTIVVPSRPKKSEYCGVSLDEETRVEIERIAVAKDVSMAWIIRDAIQEYLERRKEPHNAARTQAPRIEPSSAAGARERRTSEARLYGR